MKPHPAISKFTPALVAFGVGAAMWTFAGIKLTDPEDNRFEYRPNIFAVQGSPIGKTLALAVQSEIDFAWHEGVSNPFEAHDHSNCDHGNGVCSHGHKQAEDHGSCDHEHGHCQHDHDHEDAHEPAETPLTPSDSWLRNQVDHMTATVYENNSPYALTDRHRKHIRENVERKVEFAYNLDPENYTNYNSLHLFYETTLGNNPKSAEQLIKLAKQTRAKIREYTVDPEPWLTAASTQHNICYIIVNRLGLEGHEENYVKHLNDMRDCLIHFYQLRREKIRNGKWKLIAAPRRDQMMQRFASMIKYHDAQFVIYQQHKGSDDNLPSPEPPMKLATTPSN